MATFDSKTSLGLGHNDRPLFTSRPRWPRKSALFLLFLLAALLLVNMYQALDQDQASGVGLRSSGDALVQVLPLPE